jgi:hypothetical protein
MKVAHVRVASRGDDDTRPPEVGRAALRRAACLACREEVAMALEDRPWRVDRWPQGRGGAAMDGHLVLFATGQACCACSTVESTDKTVPYVRTGDACFCDDCWHRLPADALERIVREVALRGVPLS